MRKLFAGMFCLAVAVVFTAGCAQKSASEQLKDDMNKAAKQMDKDAKKLF